MDTSTFDFIEIEYFERRLYEIVKSSASKQEEVDRCTGQTRQLKYSIKVKSLGYECQRLQWRSVLQTYRTLRECNYRAFIDTERSNLKEQIKTLKSSTPPLEEENQTLLYKNLQLEHSKQMVSQEIQDMNKKLCDSQDGQIEAWVRQVEVYHATLRQEIVLMIQQKQNLQTLVTRQTSQMEVQTKALSQIRLQTDQLKHNRSCLHQQLCSLQISGLMTIPTLRSQSQDRKYLRGLNDGEKNVEDKYGDQIKALNRGGNVHEECRAPLETDVVERGSSPVKKRARIEHNATLETNGGSISVHKELGTLGVSSNATVSGDSGQKNGATIVPPDEFLTKNRVSFVQESGVRIVHTQDDVLKNRASIVEELRQCLENEKARREQLRDHLRVLKRVRDEDLNQWVREKENGELEYEEVGDTFDGTEGVGVSGTEEVGVSGTEGMLVSGDVSVSGETESYEKYFDTQDDQFVLENYLIFDDD